MFNTLKKYVTHEPTQREKAPGTVPNNAGGYSFGVDKWEQFKRFLIIGTTGGTYYVNESELTDQNLDAVKACIDEDGKRAVDMIVEVSRSGRAPKQDPAIFALALAASCVDNTKNNPKRKYALEALPKVCRTFTHLSHFVTFIRQGKMRGFGRQLVNALGAWYNDKDLESLAYQVIKYGSRDGYSQKDVYRLAHPARSLKLEPDSPRRLVYNYIAKDECPKATPENRENTALSMIGVAHAIKSGKYSDERILKALVDYDMPMEVVPTERRNANVYRTVLTHGGQLTWILRNLSNLAKHGVTDERGVREFIHARLTDKDQLRRARIHPLNVYTAMKQYASGKGFKSSATWTPHRDVIDALDECFYASFGYVEPTGKKLLYAVDVSDSMCGANAMDNISVFEAAAIMAMACIYVEQDFHLIGFERSAYNFDKISKRQRLDDIVKEFRQFQGGGTNCSLPFLVASELKWDIDCFVSFTDSETWAGSRHPFADLEAYRKLMNKPNAKAVNVAMTANRFSTLPTDDPRILEAIGFDLTIPQAISLFAQS